jgi:hypothetical protein
MELLTQELIKKIPTLYGQDGKGSNALAYVKLFTPDSNFTWYITELDPEEGLCFGLIDGFEKELGYFSLNEIEQIKGPMGLEVERDISFQPTKLKNLGFNYGK